VHSTLAIGWAAVAVLWSALALLGFLERKAWVRGGEAARVPFIVIGAGVCAFLLAGALAGGIALLTAALLVGAPLVWMPPAPLMAAGSPQPLAAGPAPAAPQPLATTVPPPLAASGSHERG
jgi:hypothetical protein